MRVSETPGFILHSRPFRESSSIIDVYSRDYGRIGLVARGARSAKSRWRGVMQPFRQLDFSWSKRSSLGTLTGLDIDIGWPELSGKTLYCGLYLNELLIRLSRSEDPDESLYQAYGRAIHELSALTDPRLALRRFEKQLLESLGFALPLLSEAAGGKYEGNAVDAASFYTFDPHSGPSRCQRTTGREVFSGEMLLALASNDYANPKCLPQMRRLLQTALKFQLGGRELASQKMLRKLL
ncbi:MAG: DNA repair protein RecO [Xanthomonadales bacterium]|nr:DNA repair protein RecO [Xanthomonadales bacterium]